MRNKEIWKYIKDKDLFIDNVIEFFNNALGEILFIFWNGNWKDRLKKRIMKLGDLYPFFCFLL